MTGEEKNQKTKAVPKFKQEREERKLLDINVIVVFFAITIMILGICMISSSVYANTKIHETVEANTKPVVITNRNDDDNTVEIHVTHIRPIKSIVYRWNEGEETTLSGENKTDITKTIDLIGGTNTLTVKVTEENGQTVTYRKEYTVGNIPVIELEAISNAVKIKITSEENIDYLMYHWDNDEKQTINIGDKEYEGNITAPKGEHKLYIEVVDEKGIKTTLDRKVVGDTAPTIKFGAAIIDGKVSFIVDVEDDEEIKEVEITLNSGAKQTIEVNDKTYHGEFEMTSGFNTIAVTAYNLNGISSDNGAKFTN